MLRVFILLTDTYSGGKGIESLFGFTETFDLLNSGCDLVRNRLILINHFKYKNSMKLLVLGLFILISSCEKDMKQYNLKGEEYPTGISIVDLTSENDCSLQKCSDKRIKRLV